MTRTLITLTLLAAPAAAQGFESDLMKALDVDGDGWVRADELAAASAALALLDDDGDGQLSPAESGTDFSSWDDMGDWDMGDWDMGDWDSGGWDMGGRARDDADAPAAPGLDPDAVEARDGSASLPDRDAYDGMRYREGMVMEHLAGKSFLKFQILDPEGDAPKLYFINTATHPTHVGFLNAIGHGRSDWGMRGVLVHHPFTAGVDGRPGLYTFEFELEDAYPAAAVLRAFQLLEANSELLRGRLAYHPLPGTLEQVAADAPAYAEAGLEIVRDDQLYADVAFLPLNEGVAFGRLRRMQPGQRPDPRDVVIYATLPNELPRVAGVLTGVRQTPLSHVNLRARQDGVPNAFVRGVEGDPDVEALLGEYVRLEVSATGHVLRAATFEEVREHLAGQTAAEPLTPRRDLTVTEIRPLDELGFDDAGAFGVKAANLATLRGMLPAGQVPDGHAIPFHFYTAYLQHNDLEARVAEVCRALATDPDPELRRAALRDLRREIRGGVMPEWILAALDELHASYPAGQPLRCRSSTNNEDLPGFSGAGLYDSCTHRADEGHLGKSVRQVWASLWNERAFDERAFHGVDHAHAAMGVLVHPNFDDEQANGVAVSQDVLYRTEAGGRTYYVNVQAGEDLVTNPSEGASTEERLLDPRFPRDDVRVRSSRQAADGGSLLSTEHWNRLRVSLKTVHREFQRRYEVPEGAPFAMEVEFKVTADGSFVIKQARPWIF